MKKKASLANPILFALMLSILFGVAANHFFPRELNESLVTWILNPIGNVFLRGMKMIAVPLVLCSLICGTASIGSVRRLGRLGGKIMLFYIATTILAVIAALIFANIVNPGLGLNLTLPTGYKTAEAPFLIDALVNMIPTNPIEAMVKGELLQIILFAILFGLCLAQAGEPAKPLYHTISQINSIMVKITGIVMLTAPYGVFALIARVFILQGVEVLLPLIKYTVIVLILLLFQVLLVYGSSLRFLGKTDPLKFFQKYWATMAAAFSTSCSSAVIPVNMDACHKKLGVPEPISSLAIPFGAAVHKDGTAIMQGVAVIFIVQMTGLDLSIQQQLMTILLVTLASIVTTGAPGAGIVSLTMVLQQIGIPLEGIAIVLSVDRLIDMCCTVVNVTGDAVGAVIVASSEKELDLEVYNA